MSGIFDETNMKQVLGRYIPQGETLLAGIHAIAKETSVTGVFGKCSRTEDGLIPDENGGTVALSKNGYSTSDIYFGITQSAFVIAGCERNSYYYEFDDAPAAGTKVQEVTSKIFFADIGTYFPLADIQNCEIKKGWMGSLKCSLKMKNESYFKLIFPKLGGAGGGMPHHAQYRDAITARLNGN